MRVKKNHWILFLFTIYTACQLLFQNHGYMFIVCAKKSKVLMFFEGMTVNTR